jgi:hypothetical protein
VTSMWKTWESIGIIKDPRGDEKFAAFGKNPMMTGEFGIGRKGGEDRWTPDWIILSDVVPDGTIEGLLEGNNVESAR